MKTTMQELIDWIECDNDNNVYDICDMAKELLEKEKKQIINAHLDGQSLVSCKDEYAEQYYNETFKSETIVTEFRDNTIKVEKFKKK
jgi:hypothetical protein